MSTQDDGGPAFPRDHRHDGHNGMSLRDYFAAKAMQGDIATVARGHDWVPHVDEFARNAYLMADAMLKARKQ